MLQINPFLDCTIYSGIVVHIGRNNHITGPRLSANTVNLPKGIEVKGFVPRLYKHFAACDLSGVDLIVLSACETGLGEIQGSEGVFGLQRAFKLAGAKSLILSLWKVPDSETSELMTLFYKYYLSGLTANEALKKAQNEIRKRFPDDPYYWAAFFVVD
jgi:CHAT domain-containing protein